MRRRVRTAAWLVCAALLSGFAPATGGAALEKSPAQEVSDVLEAGLNGGPPARGAVLMARAKRLQVLNARPLAGTDDLARRWRGEARASGAPAPLTGVFRGRILGPAYRFGALRPHDRFQTQQSVMAGKPAEILVTPLGKSSLSLSVTDDAGQVVCPAAISSARISCRWLPRFSGSIDIVITNPAAASADYILVLN
jgi:hypothetical protein